jgi:hypothetical protein
VSVSTALELVPPDEYLEARTHVFPSVASLRWFIRMHKAELLEQKAIVAPTGRQLISPAAFDAVVLEVGARKAKTGP